VSLAEVEKDRRFNIYGVPRNKTKAKKKDKGAETVPNANYLWINLFATSLKPTGRAALVMANSASDARRSEADIRKTLIEKNLIYGMLTLPSNMFYTVTLPATLWFFDKAKTDERILFIDARNIFTQIDRAHREFSEEQIQNIAIISRLHRGKGQDFVKLIDRYFKDGVEKLKLNKEKLEKTSVMLTNFLKSHEGNDIPNFSSHPKEISKLESQYSAYTSKLKLDDVENTNNSQKNLAQDFKPFFIAIHDMLKVIDKRVRHFEKKHGNSKEGKTVKAELDELHQEIKDAEYFFTHIDWLQERFPEAKYEDVIGLCKLATIDEVKEQDYSLNPGRYVGVVIEEDGKTEEEFIEEILTLNDELSGLNDEAKVLEDIIKQNITQVAGEV